MKKNPTLTKNKPRVSSIILSIILFIIGLASFLYVAFGLGLSSGIIEGSLLDKTFDINIRDGFVKYVLIRHVANAVAFFFATNFISQIVNVFTPSNSKSVAFRILCAVFSIFVTIALVVYMGHLTISYENVSFWKGVSNTLTYLLYSIISLTFVFYFMLPTSLVVFGLHERIRIWFNTTLISLLIISCATGTLLYFGYKGWATTVAIIYLFNLWVSPLSIIIPEPTGKPKTASEEFADWRRKMREDLDASASIREQNRKVSEIYEAERRNLNAELEARTFHHYKTTVDCTVTDIFYTDSGREHAVSVRCTATYHFKNANGCTDTQSTTFDLYQADPNHYELDCMRHAEGLSYMMQSHT